MAPRKSKRGKKPSGKKKPVIDVDKLKRDLQEMQARLREMMKEDGVEIGEEQVQSAKDFAERMQDINRGLREALKKAMMADGKIKPGEVLNIRGRRVFLKPRPGCPEGSMDPEQYDLVAEPLQ